MTGGRGRGAAALVPYALILGLTLVLAAAPQWVSLPVPKDAVPLTEALFSLDGGEAVPVTLPHRWPDAAGFGPARGIYRMSVDLPASESLLLLVPAAQHTLAVRLDGLRLWGSDRQSWGEPALASAYVLAVPPTREGPGTFEIVLDRESGAVPGYLSQLYLTGAGAAAPWSWLWSFASNGTRTAVVGLQTLVVLGITIVWLARRHDPIFAWLFLIGVGSFALSIAGVLPAHVVSVSRRVIEELFDKPDDYFNLERLRNAAGVDRRISIRELIEKAFGYIPKFKSKAELIDDEFQKFLLDQKPEEADRIAQMRYFFEAYIRDAKVRALIDAGHLGDLNVNPTFTTRDLREVPPAWRKRIPEYVKDYVSLNPFL